MSHLPLHQGRIRRVATFGVSPTTLASSAASSPTMSPPWQITMGFSLAISRLQDFDYPHGLRRVDLRDLRYPP